jgi:hypothetical protein
MLGIVSGLIGGLFLYKNKTVFSNNAFTWTILVVLSWFLPIVGLPSLLMYLVLLFITSEVSEAVELIKQGEKVKETVKWLTGSIGLTGLRVVVALVSGMLTAGMIPGVVSTVLAIILLFTKIRGEYKKGVKVTGKVIVFITVASLVSYLSVLLQMSNLVAIVCILFGVMPCTTGTSRYNLLNNDLTKRYKKEEIDGPFSSVIEFGSSLFLAIGGVNPFLLGTYSSGKGVLMTLIAAEFVPLGRWLMGKMTGKTFITELFKVTELFPTPNLAVSLIILLIVVTLVSMIIAKVLLQQAVSNEVYTLKNTSLNTSLNTNKTNKVSKTEFKTLLVLFGLGLYSGLFTSIVLICIYFVFQVIAKPLSSFLGSELAPSLPALIIALS